jgi:hypothetical protein
MGSKEEDERVRSHETQLVAAGKRYLILSGHVHAFFFFFFFFFFLVLRKKG